jgi:hypothetical protein
MGWAKSSVNELKAPRRRTATCTRRFIEPPEFITSKVRFLKEPIGLNVTGEVDLG